MNLTGISRICKIDSFGSMDGILRFLRNFSISTPVTVDIPDMRFDVFQTIRQPQLTGKEKNTQRVPNCGPAIQEGWGFSMTKTVSTLAMLALLPLAVGCVTTQTSSPGYAGLTPPSSVFRAQSPCANGQCGPSMYGPQMGGCQSCQTGGCPPGGQCQGGGCGLANGTCQPGNYGVPFHPSHRNFYTYKAPQNVVYPNPRPTPMAAINYPYYTTKGPTDFFYTGK